uniref:Uncharacterized protein n=1 Tax=Ciona savignyi TaxID=51511 RepID=H2YGD2_CIOSA
MVMNPVMRPIIWNHHHMKKMRRYHEMTSRIFCRKMALFPTRPTFQASQTNQTKTALLQHASFPISSPVTTYPTFYVGRINTALVWIRKSNTTLRVMAP